MYRLWAKQRRAEAAECRRVALAVSLHSDRDRLLKQAATLDVEAAELERMANEIEGEDC